MTTVILRANNVPQTKISLTNFIRRTSEQATNNTEHNTKSVHFNNYSEQYLAQKNDSPNILEQLNIANTQKIVHENDKIVSEQDLNQGQPDYKDLFEKYGWKEEYNYLGVKFKAPLKFYNIFLIVTLHLASAYAWYLIYERGLTIKNLATFSFGLFIGSVAGFGISGGVHRLWTHRAYKATLPMRILLAVCYSVGGQNPIPEWVRDHRVHHKYSETDADPHNSNRGFFFAHVGWLMMKKHPAVLDKGKSIDMSDVLNDPVVKFHTKYYAFMQIFFCFVLPTIIPVYLWNESWLHSFLLLGVLKYSSNLNGTWCVNSVAHMFGNRPYDKRINPVQNYYVAFYSMGEGWHNYHHAFPWDYKAAELPYDMNVTTMWLDLFAKIGWVYDRKAASQALIKSTSVKHGDGTDTNRVYLNIVFILFILSLILRLVIV